MYIHNRGVFNEGRSIPEPLNILFVPIVIVFIVKNVIINFK